MDLPESHGEGVGPRRHGDQVHVVRHEAVTEKGETMEPAVMPKQFQINEAAGVGFQDESARIAALSDVMRRINCDNAGQASHR
jgi:hypothetical protein